MAPPPPPPRPRDGSRDLGCVVSCLLASCVFLISHGSVLTAFSAPSPQPHADHVLTFDEHTLTEVVCLLRLVYHPRDATMQNFQSVSSHLPGVMRLADRLKVSEVVDGITDFVCVTSADMELDELVRGPDG